MSDFFPISPLIGITNTSYAAQAGVMDEKWAARVVRGKKIIAEKPISDLNLDALVGVVYGHIRVEGLSRHSVAMVAGRLMQFARQYQQSGVCPNYEVPGLMYDDGTPATQEAPKAVESTTGLEVPVATESESAETVEEHEIKLAPVGQLPEITRIWDMELWSNAIEPYAAIINEMAAYGASLPEGHLELMFGNIANQLLRMWASSGDSFEVITRFGEMMQACSKDSQLPKTGRNKIGIEVGQCEILRLAREIDPDGSRLPAGYPCAYHILLAKKVGEMTGVNIDINTSSTGCTVGITLK